MQVKKFEAPTVQEALNLIKTELGPEAIILSTKNNRKGFGLLSKASVEITAAISEKALAKRTIAEKIIPHDQKEKFTKLPARAQARIQDNISDYIEDRRKENYRERRLPEQKKMQGKITTNTKYADINDEASNQQHAAASVQDASYGRSGRIQQQATQQPQAQAPKYQSRLSDTVAAYFSDSPTSSAMTSTPQSSSQPARTTHAMTTATEHSQDTKNLIEDVQKLKSIIGELKSEQNARRDAHIAEDTSVELSGEFQHLLRNGIDKKYATQLIKQVSFSLLPDELKNEDKIIDTLAVELMSQIKVKDALDGIRPGQGQGPRVISLIGPTGVGKTTTIAKIASQAILEKNLKVGLINIDSYKVAAIDQMATYAKILNVPFRQASTPIELDRALAEFKPLDLVLIDTSGRSQKDTESLTQLKTMLDLIPKQNAFLILSATTRDQELQDVVHRFEIFKPSGLVFSKLDESNTYGCIYNVVCKTKLPLHYFTVGQRVPEDIEQASCERLAALILDL